MSRLEEIEDASYQVNYSDGNAFIKGALWADNNPECGKDIIAENTIFSERIRYLENRLENIKDVMRRSSELLDNIKSELYASVYTVEDYQFETIYYVRDILYKALED